MKWWDDIWLNEGFATWMANKPLAAWKPEWRVDLDAADGYAGRARPRCAEVRRARSARRSRRPSEINEVFDGIAYEKTAAVLRMIEAYVGPEAFRKGVVLVPRRSTRTATPPARISGTRWRASPGKPVDRIMKSFVDQPGAPVLTGPQLVRRRTRSELDVEGRAASSARPAAPPAPQTWTLPVCSRATDGQPKCELIDRAERTLKVDGCGATFANADSRGYYLTDYTADTVGRFAKNPRARPRPSASACSATNGGWSVPAATTSTSIWISRQRWPATTRRDHRDDRGPLESIGDDIADATERARYQAWIRAHFGPVLTELGLPGPANDGDDRQYRRGILLHLVGVVGNDPAVQATARELALRYIAGPSSVPSTLAPKVLQVAAVGGDAALYQRYLDQMKTAGAQPERYYRYFNALSWFSDPSLVKRTLELAVSPDVRSQDASTVLGSLLVHPWSSDQAWEFTKERWPALLKTLNMFQAIPDWSDRSALSARCRAPMT